MKLFFIIKRIELYFKIKKKKFEKIFSCFFKHFQKKKREFGGDCSPLYKKNKKKKNKKKNKKKIKKKNKKKKK